MAALYPYMAESGWIWFVAVPIVGLVGLFLYGWMRRKEKPPPGVKPLKNEDWD